VTQDFEPLWGDLDRARASDALTFSSSQVYWDSRHYESSARSIDSCTGIPDTTNLRRSTISYHACSATPGRHYESSALTAIDSIARARPRIPDSANLRLLIDSVTSCYGVPQGHKLREIARCQAGASDWDASIMATATTSAPTSMIPTITPPSLPAMTQWPCRPMAAANGEQRRQWPSGQER
jgi:hypothetical protein